MDESDMPEELRLTGQQAASELAAQLGALQEAREAIMQSLVVPAQQAREALRLLAAIQAAQAAQAFEIGTLRSALSPLIMATHQWAELVRDASRIIAGPLSAYANQVSLAAEVGLAQFAASALVQAGPRPHVASAHPTVRPTAAVVATVSNASESQRLSAPAKSPVAHENGVDLVALAMNVLLVSALTVPAAQLLLPKEAQDYVNSLVSALALALSIIWRLNDKRSR